MPGEWKIAIPIVGQVGNKPPISTTSVPHPFNPRGFAPTELDPSELEAIRDWVRSWERPISSAWFAEHVRQVRAFVASMEAVGVQPA